MGKSKNKKFIFDFEAQKLLGLMAHVVRIGTGKNPAFDAGDDFALCNLILDFDLIPYRKAAGRDDYEIAHDVYENPDDVVFEIGSLAFKREAVDTLKEAPGWKSTEPAESEHHLKRLTARRQNILRLQQSRAQLSLGPSRILRDALAATEKEIGDFGGIKKHDGELEVSHRARFQVPEGTKWNNIEIVITSEDTARIKTPNVNRLVKYSDLGMADKRSLQPDQSWALLKIFAEYSSIGPGIKTGMRPRQVSKAIERLGAKLRGAFGIVDRPFSEYRSYERWDPLFKLEDRREQGVAKESSAAPGGQHCERRDPNQIPRRDRKRPEDSVEEKTVQSCPCDACPKRPGCKQLCPPAEKFFSRGQVPLREILESQSSRGENQEDYEEDANEYFEDEVKEKGMHTEENDFYIFR